MTTPLRLSVSTNASAEITRLEAEIAALQLRLNSKSKQDVARYKIFGGSWLKVDQTRLTDLQTRLSVLKDPSATPGITPSPVTSSELPVFGLPKLDIGRVEVADLKLVARSRG